VALAPIASITSVATSSPQICTVTSGTAEHYRDTSGLPIKTVLSAIDSITEPLLREALCQA